MTTDELDPGTLGRLERLADQLDRVSEDLGDLSMTLLRDALDAGATRRPDVDRTLAQARRAVDKAAGLLRP